MSTKLPVLFDQNPSHTFDKTVEIVYNKKCPQSLTFSPNVKIVAEFKRTTTMQATPPKN